MTYIAKPSESLSKNIDFFVLFTTLDITPTGNYLDQSQKNYTTVVSMVSIRAQPILNSSPVFVEDLEAAGATELEGEGYVWKFAVEHSEAFALHNENLQVVDGVYYLKAIFEGAEIGEVVIETEGDDQNIEFKRYESL